MAWPEYDESKCVESTVEIVVQINGKVRDRITVAADIDQAAALAQAKESQKVQALTEGKTIVKEIYVKGKLVNIVVR